MKILHEILLKRFSMGSMHQKKLTLILQNVYPAIKLVNNPTFKRIDLKL